MAVHPTRTATDVLTSTPTGRHGGGNQVHRQSGSGDGKASGRLVAEPAGGYDPRAPRGTYLDITV